MKKVMVAVVAASIAATSAFAGNFQDGRSQKEIIKGNLAKEYCEEHVRDRIMKSDTWTKVTGATIPLALAIDPTAIMATDRFYKCVKNLKAGKSFHTSWKTTKNLFWAKRHTIDIKYRDFAKKYRKILK